MFAVGDLVDDKYRVLGRLGGGGFGDVFLAEDEGIPGRQLALKVLNAGKAADEGALVREMQVLAKFSHPGIVGFLHHFRHSGRLVLVMVYCPGGSLADRLSRTRHVPIDEVFRWGGVLCDTLAFVHAQGIVHHDIKPANILFGQDGSIQVGDFGVANLHAGTELYLAPEMLLGEAVSRLDVRVDIYALGLTLVEAIAGEMPFEALQRSNWLKAKCAHDTVPKGLPTWAQEVLLRATHPTPELRFQSMTDFAEAIQSRHVLHVFDAKRMRADAAAQLAERHLVRKKWKPAQRLTEQALLLYPDSTPALLAAGRCQLLLRRTADAKALFDRALKTSPRVHVQKELGWLNLELGHLPLAISLLSDHLDREPSDQEACNLLLKCYWTSGRYDLGESLARMLMEEAKYTDECFRNNRFLCRLLNGGYRPDQLETFKVDASSEPFLAYNLTVAREKPSCWSPDDGPSLKDKLLFQEFRFRVPGRDHRISLRIPGSERMEVSEPVVSLGSMPANDAVIAAPDVSRRHAAIVNLRDEVWVYDLGSTYGTRVDGAVVEGRRFLDGVHRISLGSREVEVGARADLLV